MDLKALLLNLNLGDPQSFQELTLYPLLGDSAGQLDYITLKEALQTRSIEIEEIGHGTVATLLVTNYAAQDVLIIGGEELLGAMQNRVVNVSVMVGARSSLKIPVSCTERGRWHTHGSGGSMRGVSGHMSTVPIRQILTSSVSQSLKTRQDYKSDQTGIWDSISETLATFSVRSPTFSQSAAFSSSEAAFQDSCASWQPCTDQVGVIALIGDEVISLDLFSNTATFAQLFPKLLRAYTLEACSHRQNSPVQSATGIARFIPDLQKARYCRYPAPGKGCHLSLEGELQSGMALIVDDHVVHLCAFPRATATENQQSRHWWTRSRGNSRER